MQSASVLLDSSAMASKPQQASSENASAGGGLFDSELKQQQQQIDGKSTVDHDGDHVKRHESTSNSTQSGDSERRSQDRIQKKESQNADGDQPVVKGQATDGEPDSEGESIDANGSVDATEGQPEVAALVAIEPEIEPTLVNETLIEGEPSAPVTLEQLESLANELTTENGKMLPLEHPKDGKGVAVATEQTQDEVILDSAEGDKDQKLASLAGVSETGAQDIDSELTAENRAKPVVKEDASVQLSGKNEPNIEAEVAHTQQQVASEHIPDELPQVIVAPSMKGMSAAQIPLQSGPINSNGVADATATPSANRADVLGLAGGTSATSNPNANSNPNSDSMAGRQTFTNVNTATNAEGDAPEATDKMAAFLATLKSVAKEGVKGGDVANASQAGAKSQPVAQMVSNLGTLQGAPLSQSQPASATAPVTGSVATSNSTPALMTIATSMRQQGWDRAMGERLVFMARNGLQQAKIEVNPRQMGPIEIKVSVNQEQQASVSFLTTNSAARETIDAAMPRLKEMFDQAGLNLAESEVSQRDERQSAESDSADDDSDSAGTMANGTEEELETLTSAQVGYVRPSGLDLFA